jgi:hypothetical protein
MANLVGQTESPRAVGLGTAGFGCLPGRRVRLLRLAIGTRSPARVAQQPHAVSVAGQPSWRWHPKPDGGASAETDVRPPCFAVCRVLAGFAGARPCPGWFGSALGRAAGGAPRAGARGPFAGFWIESLGPLGTQAARSTGCAKVGPPEQRSLLMPSASLSKMCNWLSVLGFADIKAFGSANGTPFESSEPWRALRSAIASGNAYAVWATKRVNGTKALYTRRQIAVPLGKAPVPVATQNPHP